LPQSSIVDGRVRDAIPLLWDVVATLGVDFERHDNSLQYVTGVCPHITLPQPRQQRSLQQSFEALDMVHGIREQQAGKRHSHGVLLWPWSRMTGWRAVHDVMVAARLEGPHASPKGLRHGFGVAAVSAGIPLNLVQKWLGHAQLTTTAIYADAVGAEEKDIARRMWG